MKKEELEFILEKGEGYFVEFKEKLDKSFAHELVAFANGSGGRIIIGINDKNKITGIDISNKLKSQTQDIARNIQPSINILLHSIENVLIVTVPEGIDKPYHCSDGFYLRMGPNSQKMNRSQIIDFLQTEGKVKFEEQFHRYFDFEKHYNSAKLIGFLKLADITRNLDDIITNIDNALHFIKQALKVKYIMTGEARRNEIYEIPLQAIREAVVNAVAHRDYFATGAHTTIEIFDDRIEIGNPGGLPKGLSSDTFGKKAVRRNPIITNLLQRCKFVENVGTGINKIRQLCFENNIPEPEFTFNNFFTVIFKRHTLNDGLNNGLNGGLNGGLNDRQKLVLNYIKENPGTKVNKMVIALNIPVDTMDKYIKLLVDKDYIERRGSKKTGGYFVIK